LRARGLPGRQCPSSYNEFSGKSRRTAYARAAFGHLPIPTIRAAVINSRAAETRVIAGQEGLRDTGGERVLQVVAAYMNVRDSAPVSLSIKSRSASCV
jgi:hypothetical protein